MKVPNKTIEITETHTFNFDDTNNTTKLSKFLEWVTAIAPNKIKDITLQLNNPKNKDDNPSLKISWKTTISNSKYEKQVEKFLKKARKKDKK